VEMFYGRECDFLLYAVMGLELEKKKKESGEVESLVRREKGISKFEKSPVGSGKNKRTGVSSFCKGEG